MPFIVRYRDDSRQPQDPADEPDEVILERDGFATIDSAVQCAARFFREQDFRAVAIVDAQTGAVVHEGDALADAVTRALGEGQ